MIIDVQSLLGLETLKCHGYGRSEGHLSMIDMTNAPNIDMRLPICLLQDVCLGESKDQQE